jgi:hypothetical protein
MNPEFINVSFNGHNAPFVARRLDLTGSRTFYLIDGECETIEYLRENFTFLDAP